MAVKRFDQEAVRKIFVELIANYMTADQTKDEIASQIAEIVAGAPESLDTLKEIADWIEKHADSASAMNSEINANTESISALQTLVSALETQVAELEAEGGEPNVIETVKRNGVTLTVTDKAVDIAVPESMSELTDDVGYAKSSEIPTKVSELTNDSGYITSSDVPTKLSELTDDVGYAKASDVDSEMSEVNKRIDDIEAKGGEPNVIEVVKQNGTALTVTDKTVDVTVPTKLSELENDEGFIDSAVKPNILRGTNSCTELLPADTGDSWSEGKWETYSDDNVPTPIEVSVSGYPDITEGWNIGSGGVVQSDIPVQNARSYTLSFYARGSGTVSCYEDGNSVKTSSLTSSNSWNSISCLMYVSADSTRVTLAIKGSSTCNICGMKLEEGDTATPWCPSYWDMENKNGRLVYDEETETIYY